MHSLLCIQIYRFFPFSMVRKNELVTGLHDVGKLSKGIDVLARTVVDDDPLNIL